jgi:hypothetical protein
MKDTKKVIKLVLMMLPARSSFQTVTD